MNPSTRLTTGVVVGFAVMFLVNAVAAAVIIDPLFGDDYPEVAADGATLDWPLLIGGYALIAIAIGWLHRREPQGSGWLGRGLRVGVPIGLASFVGVHLVQAGYTTIDNTAWILSGLLDVFGPIAASLVIARFATGKRLANEPGLFQSVA